jgi:hypothetical protein
MPHEGEDKGNKVQTSSLFFLDFLMLISFQPLFHIFDKKFRKTEVVLRAPIQAQ